MSNDTHYTNTLYDFNAVYGWLYNKSTTLSETIEMGGYQNAWEQVCFAMFEATRVMGITQYASDGRVRS